MIAWIKKLIVAGLGFIYIVFFANSVLAETLIKGKVVEVDADIKISYEGKWAPELGDSVEIGFELGDDFIPVEGDWQIVLVEHKHVWARNKGSAGEKPAEGYLVKIQSKDPWIRAELLPPKPMPHEKNTSEEGAVLFFDNFDNNQKGWKIIKAKTHESAIKTGTYVIETKNEKPTYFLLKQKLKFPDNFRMEAKAMWKKGVTNWPFGFIIAKDRKNQYRFGISGDGGALVIWRVNGKAKEVLIKWKQFAKGRVPDGKTFDNLRIDSHKDQITFYVNDHKIGTIQNNMIKTDWFVGFFVRNTQKAAFDDLKITRLN